VSFLALAALLLVAQFVSAFFVHVAVRARPTGAGWVVAPTQTYIQAFGASVVILTVLSMGALVFVGSVLMRRSGRDVLGAGPLAWGVSAVAAALGLVGFVYLFGVGVCMLIACATVPRRSSVPPTGRRASVASAASAVRG
jgi:hypothetical protein